LWIVGKSRHGWRIRPQPRTHNPQPLSHGFTLIEILVVVVILGVLAAALVLSVAVGGGERQLEREAEQMRALLGYACEQAELSGREIGISLNTAGYRFNREGELRPRHWLAGSSAALTREGHAVEIAVQFPDKPQLLCFSSGELTPFRLDLGLADITNRYRLDGQPDGTVDLATVAVRGR
jgi:general secretion pathway protein H